MFMPPVKPTRPSTTMIFRWFRRLAYRNRAGISFGRNRATRTPAALNPAITEGQL